MSYEDKPGPVRLPQRKNRPGAGGCDGRCHCREGLHWTIKFRIKGKWVSLISSLYIVMFD